MILPAVQYQECKMLWGRNYNIFTSFFIIMISQSSYPDVFCKKGVLRNFTKFTGRHLCQSLFFNKAAGLSPATLLKKRLWHRCFFYEFCKISNNTFCYRTPLVAASVKSYYHSSTLTFYVLLKIFSRSIFAHLLKTSFMLS